MTVLVTGASGHIGANLTRELLRQKRPTRVLIHNDARGVKGLDLEIKKGDILDYPSLIRAVKGCDVVYHLAARISIVGDRKGQVRQTNVRGTQNIIKACLQNRVKRLVHFSSIHAYCAFPLDQPIDETRPFSDSSSPVYDCSKADGTKEILEAAKTGLDAVVISPTAVIGPNDFGPSRMGKVLMKLYHQKFIALINGGYDWVDVRDVVRGALRAEKEAESGSQFILSGHWRSILQIAEIVRELRGIKPPRFTAPIWMARLAAPFSELWARIRKTNPLLTTEALKALETHRFICRTQAEDSLDYHPRPLKQTIQDTLEWFDNKGMLD
ncbi:MAG: NAD-dependent epimerase/dehydratase family protein [Candidatus Aminicenantes bacterium]|nr:NAD-dependent epimerase/dehydratase family protein [Candidatus Aminicenantes bacterium]